MRQAFLGKQAEGGFALRGDGVIAGQRFARVRKNLRQLGFRRGLDRGDSGVHATTSS